MLCFSTVVCQGKTFGPPTINIKPSKENVRFVKNDLASVDAFGFDERRIRRATRDAAQRTRLTHSWLDSMSQCLIRWCSAASGREPGALRCALVPCLSLTVVLPRPEPC